MAKKSTPRKKQITKSPRAPKPTGPKNKKGSSKYQPSTGYKGSKNLQGPKY